MNKSLKNGQTYLHGSKWVWQNDCVFLITLQ